MSQKKLSDWLKVITVVLGIIGAVVYLVILPVWGKELSRVEGAESFFLPWLIFLLITAIPCYICLAKFWNICMEIGKDNSFSKVNAIRLRDISVLVLIDIIYFSVGNIVLLLFNMNHPGIMLLSFFGIDIIGIAIAIAAAMLSRLVLKAAELKTENDLTI